METTPNLWAAILVAIIQALIPILMGAISLVAVGFFNNLKAKTQNARVWNAIDHLDKYIQAVIDSLNQTVVPEVIRSANDGKISKEEAKRIKDLAVDEVLKLLPDTMKALLGEAIGSLGDYIGHRIEQTIFGEKAAALVQQAAIQGDPSLVPRAVPVPSR